MHDDLLGIWGDPEITGKSNMSDLITRKKTLPILYGLAQNKRFAQMWEEEITALNAPQLADELQEEGAYDYTKSRADEYTRSAISALEAASPTGPTAKALSELIHSLIERKN